MGLHFIFNGVRQGEPGVLATLEEHPTQLARIIEGFGSADEEGASYVPLARRHVDRRVGL
jgi:KaiC/GvpD/RAD55 family RecA-like ATPase